MIVVRYAVCSEKDRKPLTRVVSDSRAEAERVLEELRRREDDPGTTYWTAELGPECDAWRHLGSDAES